MNAETDAAVGPILKVYADRSGVVYTYTDGDEPGVAMNLFRFVDSIGYKPVMLGQIKGFLESLPQPGHAARIRGEARPEAGDGRLVRRRLEARARVGDHRQRDGLHARRCAACTATSCKHVKDLLNHFTPEDFANGGLVDFVLGAEPHTGAFVMGYNDHPVKTRST